MPAPSNKALLVIPIHTVHHDNPYTIPFLRRDAHSNSIMRCLQLCQIYTVVLAIMNQQSWQAGSFQAFEGKQCTLPLGADWASGREDWEDDERLTGGGDASVPSPLVVSV